MLNTQEENKEIETSLECMHDQLRTEDCEVSLDGSKEKGQSSNNPSNDSPWATEVGVEALCDPHFQSAVIVPFRCFRILTLTSL